jgi:hypothetical protein
MIDQKPVAPPLTKSSHSELLCMVEDAEGELEKPNASIGPKNA